MPVIVCSLMPGERLNLGPLERRVISWALRLLVRSVTRLGLLEVTSEELVVIIDAVQVGSSISLIGRAIWTVILQGVSTARVPEVV